MIQGLIDQAFEEFMEKYEFPDIKDTTMIQEFIKYFKKSKIEARIKELEVQLIIIEDKELEMENTDTSSRVKGRIAELKELLK